MRASLPCRDAMSATLPPRARGLTLLELLIVIALMAIVAGFVIPMFNGPVSTSELRASARQLAAGLRLARSEALAERRETFLVVDVAGKRFKVDRDPAEHKLSSRIDVKLFTAQNDLVSDKRRIDPLLPRRRQQRRPHHRRGGRAQVRRRRRLADRSCRDPRLT